MTDAWYYAKGSQPVGPLSLAELKAAFILLKDWRDLLVWNPAFKEWRKAGTIPELESPVPPPLPVVTSKTSRWRRIAYAIPFLIFGLVVKEVVHDYLHTARSAAQDAKIEEALDLAERQATTPQKIDDVTTLVAVKHTGPRELTYSYKLETKDHTIPDGFVVPLRKEVALKVCKKMQYALELGVTLEYQYRSSDGLPVGRFSLNKNDCGSSSASNH